MTTKKAGLGLPFAMVNSGQGSGKAKGQAKLKEANLFGLWPLTFGL